MKKKFRFDLAMRLGHPLIIPPLRERLDDLKLFHRQIFKKRN
jgi:Transcriptional regulator containing PAS, AAA-type ATPase, and DNA-binding domains